MIDTLSHAFSCNTIQGLIIDLPESIRQSPPCKHAGTFVVTEASV